MNVDPTGYVLDAGAFIAIEKLNENARALLEKARRIGIPLVTSAGVVAQVWRGGHARQVPLAFLLARTEIIDLKGDTAKLLGLMLRDSKTSDPVDAHVTHLARERSWRILTSDPDNLLAIDPTLYLEVV